MRIFFFGANTFFLLIFGSVIFFFIMKSQYFVIGIFIEKLKVKVFASKFIIEMVV